MSPSKVGSSPAQEVRSAPKVMKQARSDQNFIGVPPDMTESLNK